MRAPEGLDYRYLEARASAMAADDASDWTQLVGPQKAAGGPAGEAPEPDIAMTMTPKGPAQPPPSPYGTEFPNIMADTIADLGKQVGAALKPAASAVGGAIGTALDVAFNPPIVQRIVKRLGGTPIASLEDAIRAGGDEKELQDWLAIPEGVRTVIESSVSAGQGMSFKGKQMGALPAEAPAAKELLQGAVEPGATPRINMERISASDRTKAVMERINQLNVESGATEEAVRGVVSHADTKTAARELISSGKLTAEKLLDMPSGTFLEGIAPEAQALAARNIRVASETHLRQLAEAVVKGDSQAADLLYDAMAANAAIDLKVTAMSASAGRTLDIHNVMAEAEAGMFDPASLREIAERLRIGGAAVTPGALDPSTLMILANAAKGTAAVTPAQLAQTMMTAQLAMGEQAMQLNPTMLAILFNATQQSPGANMGQLMTTLLAARQAAPSLTPQALTAAVTAGQAAAAATPSPINPTTLATMILNTQTLAGARGVRAFTRQAAQAKGTTFTDMVYEAWVNGLLSNPETHGRNLEGGLLQAVLGVPIRAMARTMSSDPDGVVSGEATAMLYALISNINDGLKLGWQALRAGQSQFGGVQQVMHPLSISGLGLESASRGYLSAGGFIGRGFDLMGTVVRMPNRLLMSSDDVLKLMNYRAELAALALRDGVQQGKTGAALAAHIAAVKANPPPLVHEAAKKYAAYSTYVAEYGKIGQWVSQGRDLVPGGRWVLPFLRVQTNIPKMAFEMIPGLNLALRSVREDIMAGGARRDLAVAKMALGSMMMASAAAMAAGGQLTGAGPTDPDLNTIWRRTHQEYSFKFPGSDTWISYKWMGPLAMVFAIPATMVEMGEGLPEAGWDQLAMAGTLATAEVFLDQTYSKGLFDVVNAMREPETKGMDYLRTFARSFVPGLIGEAEKIIDSSQASSKPPPAWFGYYDTRGQHQWQWVDALLAQWAARTPGFSSKLKPARDVWGNVRSQSFGIKEEGDDPVDKELLRLRLPLDMPASTIAGPDAPDSPYADQDRPNVGVALAHEEYDEYVRLAGNELKLPNDLAGGTYGLHDALAKFIASPHYRTLTDGRDGSKAFQIRRMVHIYRQAAQVEMLKRHPDLSRLVQQRKEERIKARVGGDAPSPRQSYQELLGISR